MGKWVRTYEEWVEPATWGVMTILCPSSRSLLRVETPPWSESSPSNGSAQGQSTSEILGFCAAQAFFWCVGKACCTFPENVGRKACSVPALDRGHNAVPVDNPPPCNIDEKSSGGHRGQNLPRDDGFATRGIRKGL